MPRTCLACSSPEREAIDKALVAGEPLRNIAKRFAISPASLHRHSSHVAGAIVKAQERREGKLGDSIFDELQRDQLPPESVLTSHVKLEAATAPTPAPAPESFVVLPQPGNIPLARRWRRRW
jgi:hypothetical protein